ncbi:Hypothetical predicted protein [Mytilus galloprovincialis]|uniref:ShKT domain-containing protein n=1 Tax=Mytilus galloprovincialis TaxID=29158 RepID=A0A8B6GE57_MYTGA|nr:Hypothetical predicted protein [Mytilus galloprovincialis]
MDVNSILVIYIVCISFRLSSPFVVNGLNGIVSSLKCLGEVCKQNGESAMHPYCEIEYRRDRLRGDCDESAYIHKVCPQQDDSSCRCYDQSCIDGVVEKHRQQLQLHRMTYTCLKETCHGDDYCHIHKEYNEIVSSCHENMHTDHVMCLDHDSVTSSRGCYCSTAECVQRTALHCLGVNCQFTEGCRIDQYSGQFQASCYTLHTCHHCIPRCPVPLIFDPGHVPCHCNSQDCADNIQAYIQTTNTPTTTVLDLQQLGPYTCVAEACGKHQNYCNLYESNNIIQGRCVIFQAGQLCTSSNDVSVIGGCYCSDSQCVTKAIMDYNKNHIAVPTHASEYLCNQASCRSDMFCQLFTYQGVATSRCLAFHIGKNCLSYKDIDEGGCICNTNNCATNILAEYALNHQATSTSQTTIRPATTTTPSTTTTPVTIPPTSIDTSTITTIKFTASTLTISTPRTTSITTTTTAICQDKPGVDCLLLNSTNICVNPFSHQYCAKFCGHCTRVLEAAFG